MTTSSCSPSRIMIVGARGGFGSLFSQLLANGCDLVGVDVRDDGESSVHALHPSHDWSAITEALQGSEIVLFCVSEPVIASTIQQYVAAARHDAVFVDICSTKRSAVRLISEATAGSGVQHLSIHPMFGPSVGFGGQNVIRATRPTSRSASWLVEQIQGWGGIVHDMTPEQHDSAVVGTQVLCHATIMLYAIAVARLGIPMDDLRAVQTPNSRILTSLAARLSQADPDLYLTIQESAEQQHREALVNAARLITNTVQSGDRNAFGAFFPEIRNWLGQECTAYQSTAQSVMDFLRDRDTTNNDH